MKKSSFCLLFLLVACTLGRRVLPTEELPWFEPDEIFDHDKINSMTPDNVKEATKVQGMKDTNAYSGYVEINEETHASMFFVFYESMNKDPNAPVILWLQGGPGCSDWSGNYGEMGPHELVKENGEFHLKKREFSWNEEYHLLFVDNPVGSGYSYAGKPAHYVKTQEQMGLQLYYVLQMFFQKFNDYSKNDLYIFGESYAGKYIPAISVKILESNNSLPEGFIPLNLQAVGIGDGWTDPVVQSQYYAMYGFANGLIDETQYAEIVEDQEKAVDYYNRGEMGKANIYMNLPVTKIQAHAGHVNEYNFRVWGEYPDLNTPFLNKSEIKEAYHVPDFVRYTDCNGPAYAGFNDDEALSIRDAFPYILSEIPVLFYNGQNDLIVGTPGSEAWIRLIDWPHQEEYQTVKRKVWRNQDGHVAGYVRSVQSLVQAVVADAGHMVPKDQIKNSQNMVNRFVAYSKKYHKQQESGADFVAHMEEIEF